MDIFKAIKGALYENGAPTEKTVKPEAMKPIVSTPSQYVPISPVTITSTNYSEFKDYFNKLFANANLPGPDLHEFMTSLEMMLLNMPEQVAYQTAFKTLGTMGLTKEILIDSSQKYLAVIAKDAEDYSKHMEGVYADKAGNKQAQADALKQTNTERLAQIAKLQELIARDTIESSNLIAEANMNGVKIQELKNSYQLASDEMTRKINSTVDKIKTLL